MRLADRKSKPVDLDGHDNLLGFWGHGTWCGEVPRNGSYRRNAGLERSSGFGSLQGGRKVEKGLSDTGIQGKQAEKS